MQPHFIGFALAVLLAGCVGPRHHPIQMDRLDEVMGTLLETWGQRYAFKHDRVQHKITFEVPGFTLSAVESRNDEIALLFEEAGTRHRVECSVAEAPKLIEALLFPTAKGK